jgi:uncharacterized glyoxalase superfamily protein PhnB
MNEADPRAPRAPWLMPYLTVRDAQASLDFYATAFGFVAGQVATGDDGAPEHCELYYRDQLIAMFASEGAFGSTARSPRTLGIEPTQTFYVYCSDPDRIFAQALAAGAHGVVPPSNQFWGDRMCCVRDPDGYQWSFARWLGPAASAAGNAA